MRPSASILKQILASSLTLTLHLSMGICYGYSAVLLPQLQAKNSTLPVNDIEASWIASTSMPISALMVGVLMDIFGRKRTIQLAYIPLTLGWAMISLADSVFVLCVGRVITGIAVGMDPAVIIYIVETISPKYRGIFLSLTSPLITIGILISHLLGHFLYWKHAALTLSIFACLCGALLFFIPESPAWLVLKGRSQEASDSLLWFHGRGQVADSELQTLQNAQTKHSISDAQSVPALQRVIQSKAWKPFGILALFFYLSQFTGSSVIFFYSVNFYESLDTQMDSFVASIVYIILALSSSLAFAVVVERYNRRALLITSAAGLGVTLAMAGIYEYLFGSMDDRPVAWFPVVCTWISGAFNTIGLWPLPWLMTGELLPLKVRGLLSGVLWTISHIISFIVVKLYFVTIAYLKIYGILGIFSVIALFAVPFGKFILLETRGKTLIEIENSW